MFSFFKKERLMRVKGLKQADAGQKISHEDVRQQMKKWLE